MKINKHPINQAVLTLFAATQNLTQPMRFMAAPARIRKPASGSMIKDACSQKLCYKSQEIKQQSHNFFQAPNMFGNSRRHRGSATQGLMDAGKIVVHVMERYGRFTVFKFVRRRPAVKPVWLTYL